MISENQEVSLQFTEEHANDGEHPDNAWQESIYISFTDDNKGVGGVFRIGLEPNQGRATCCATLWREGAESYNYFYRHHKMPEGDLSDLTVGPVHYEVIEPLKKVRATLKDADADLSVEINWEGKTPVFDFATDNPNPLKGWTSQHYEQFGRYEAKVKWGDESFELGGITFRDHSWGIRQWERGWDWLVTGGIFLPNENILYVWKDSRDGQAGDGGLVLSHMDPDKDTRVKFALADYRPVFDPPPIPTMLSYTLDSPAGQQKCWGRAVAPTLVMPYGKAHFTTALYRWDVDGEMAYGIVDNFAGTAYSHQSSGSGPAHPGG
ncbi:MAG: hypothetical protein IH957_00595 [Chloroflexi bacterium]|nr:hypothetical protein [Chloroflexota bacterium]